MFSLTEKHSVKFCQKNIFSGEKPESDPCGQNLPMSGFFSVFRENFWDFQLSHEKLKKKKKLFNEHRLFPANILLQLKTPSSDNSNCWQRSFDQPRKHWHPVYKWGTTDGLILWVASLCRTVSKGRDHQELLGSQRDVYFHLTRLFLGGTFAKMLKFAFSPKPSSIL